MKKIFLLLTLGLLSIATQAQEVKWMSFNDAITAQKKNKKPIFMDVYTVWCGPCKMLDKSFSDPAVAELINKNYNPVKFNAEGNEAITFRDRRYSNPNYDENRKSSRNAMHEFTGFLKIQAYPSMIIIQADIDKPYKTLLGYKTPEQLLTELK